MPPQTHTERETERERQREGERERERASSIRFMTWRVSKESRDFSHITNNQVKVVGTQQSC